MDEPLSNLDAKLRVQMRAELARLRHRLGATTVYVTHDQIEAMTLGDRVAVLSDGVLQQVDTPQRLFNEPANLFVAAFIGSPSMNLVEATCSHSAVSFAGFSLPIPGDRDLSSYEGRTVIVGMRPSDFEDADVWHREGLPVMDVTADITEELGTEIHVIFTVDAPPVVLEDAAPASEGDGEEVLTTLAEGRATFTARVGARSTVRSGQPIRLTVDPASLHFFDPTTGRAVGTRREAATPAQR
jgi:multiple sugar transport system ATP-binding protein